jgi:hypothetical protein
MAIISGCGGVALVAVCLTTGHPWLVPAGILMTALSLVQALSWQPMTISALLDRGAVDVFQYVLDRWPRHAGDEQPAPILDPATGNVFTVETIDGRSALAVTDDTDPTMAAIVSRYYVVRRAGHPGGRSTHRNDPALPHDATAPTHASPPHHTRTAARTFASRNRGSDKPDLPRTRVVGAAVIRDGRLAPHVQRRHADDVRPPLARRLGCDARTRVGATP